MPVKNHPFHLHLDGASLVAVETDCKILVSSASGEVEGAFSGPAALYISFPQAVNSVLLTETKARELISTLEMHLAKATKDSA